MDWRASGRLLREKWLRQARALEKAFADGLNKELPMERSEFDFIRSLYQHARGKSSWLIEYLRSDRPLSALDRELFAQVLEGVLDRKATRGRRPNRDARLAAMQASVFYKM